MNDPNKAADPLLNPKDPLRQAGPEAGRELFRRFSQSAHGFPRDATIDAAMNLLISAIRQECPTRQAAERRFDECVGRAKHLLLDLHYEASGGRKNIFPSAQRIEVPFLSVRRD